MNRRHSEKGFSLFDVLIAMVALIVVLGIVVAFLLHTTGAADSVTRRGRIVQDGRRALEALVQDLRFAEGGGILLTKDNGSSRIDYLTPAGTVSGGLSWSSPVTIRCEPSTVDSNRNGVADEGMLVRSQDGRSRVLTHHVPPGGFTVSRVGDNLSLRLDLAMATDGRRTVEATLETSVTVRNGLSGH